MKDLEIIGSINSGLGDSQIDVVLFKSSCSDGEEREVVALQLSTTVEGIGRQVQKTIPVSSDQIGRLQRLLINSRNRIDEAKEMVGAKAQIIEMPGKLSKPISDLNYSINREDAELQRASL